MPSRLSHENEMASSCESSHPNGATPFPSLTEGESGPDWHATTAEKVGIDRLSLSFPVRDWLELGRWEKREDRADGSWSAQARVGAPGTPEVMVGLRTIAGQPWGKVECNPSRFVDPQGCALLPVRQLDAALAVMWSAAGELTRPGCPLQDARVKRVDVARDFRSVTSTALYVEGLGPVHRPYARRSFTYNDPAKGNAQTLYVGSKAGGVRLYDQHEAYADKGAPEGALRWEVEARTGWLERVGVRRVGDLDAVSVARLARGRWEWSRMGEPVTGPVNAVQVLQRRIEAGEISRTVAVRLAGELLFQSFGYGGQARRSEYRYREVLSSVGLTTSALWSNDLAAQAVGRLDFDTGTEELALSSGP
jgi:hypothetical protein